MKSTMKKITASLLALLMMIQLVPAFAATYSSDMIAGDPAGYKESLEIVASNGTYVLMGQTLKLDTNEDYWPEWTSGNPAVATVDVRGIITAVTPGIATITATVEEPTAQTATIDITVIDPEPILTGNGGEEDEGQTPISSDKQLVIVINGENERVMYDGKEHVLNTYVATANEEFFDESKIKVEGELSVIGTDCGLYELNLDEVTFTYDDAEVEAFFVLNNGFLKITPAPLTVTALAVEKEKGEEDPNLPVSIEGLLGEDSEDEIKYTISREPGEEAGTYRISLEGEEKQANYRVAYKVEGDLTIKDSMVESPLYNIAQIGSKYYRLRKTTIRTHKTIDEHVANLTVDGHANVLTPSDYSVEDYDFDNEIITVDKKRYAYISRVDDTDLEVDGYYTAVLKEKEEVTAVRKKIGAVGNWLLPEAYRYNDENKTNSFHRNYTVTLIQKADIKKNKFTSKTVYNMLSVNGEKNYYRLKKGTILTNKEIEAMNHGTKLNPSEYKMNQYDFTNVVITLDGVDYIYSPVELDDEYVSYYTVTFETVIKEDRFNNDANWYNNTNGYLDNSQGDYAGLTNETQGFHANYKAITHKGKDREKSVTITSDWPTGKPAFAGTKITLTAHPQGFTEGAYQIQWQYSTDNITWIDIEGENAIDFTYTLDNENTKYNWRVTVADTN